MTEIKFVPRDAEDREIMAELEKDGVKINAEVPEKKEEPAKPEEKKEEVVIPPKKDDDIIDPKVIEPSSIPEKKPRFVPAWQVAIMKQNHEKEVNTLKEQLKTVAPKPNDTPEVKEDKEAKITAMAEKYGRSPEEIKEILSLTDNSAVIKELTEKVSKIEPQVTKMSEKTDWEEEDRNFENKFEIDVVPLLKEEGILEANIPHIKKRLHKMAFSKAYMGVPTMKALYLGFPDEFQDLKKTGKPGVEGGRHSSPKGPAKKDLKDLTEGEAAATLSDEEFDEYCKLKDSKKRYTPLPVNSLKGKN